MDKQAKIFSIVVFLLLAVVIIGLATAKPFSIRALAQCKDGIDNDGDTFTDWPNDPGCSSRNDNSELNANIQCDDNLDNDGDTKVDYPDDPGCTSPSDTSELGTVQCDNGVDDNDADTLKDWPNDPGCVSLTDTSEVDGACDDRTDNDFDGFTDYPSDPECTSFASQEGNCADSDGGYVLTVQGTVSGSIGGVPYSHTDSCTGTNTTGIIENYCFAGNPASSSTNYGSGTSCVNGACV